MKNNKSLPNSLLATATVMCTTLYAVSAYATAYIVSPWGTGQFRPAVVVPALFGAIFGPMPAAVGAAIGTLIADSIKHGQLYLKSLIAAVPGNFIGFYIYGLILKKKFSWENFVKACLTTLLIGNLIVSLGILVYYYLFMPQFFSSIPLSTWGFTAIGLTTWFFVTMLPFMILLTPILIKSVCKAAPSLTPNDIKAASLKQEFPKITFGLTMLIPGVIMLVIGWILSFTKLGDLVVTGLPTPALTLSLIKILFYGAGVGLFSLGALIITKRIKI
ncbi:hypothetical protein KEJ50_01315 [Candidatus Bathyarchaeota archaeon]|nr:hypothetical protein [Candidatus Bathyarchaeota archaeon]